MERRIFELSAPCQDGRGRRAAGAFLQFAVVDDSRPQRESGRPGTPSLALRAGVRTPVPRRFGFVGLFAATCLAVNLLAASVDAQDVKVRRAEKRARRSQQTAGANADRDAASDTAHDANAHEKSGSQETDSNKSDGDESALTLRDVIGFASESRDAVKAVKDYTAVFSKTEMVKGKLIKQEMQMKFRAKPFSVYFLYRGGSTDGRQVIYVDGRYQNKLIVKDPNGLGSIVPGGNHLRLDDPRVVAENRYPVTHVGIANLLETTIRDWEKESKVQGDEVDVQFFPNARLKDVPCQAVQVKHLKKLNGLPYHMNRVYFDKETKLPVRAERYGWPAHDGDKPPLLEEYRYMDLKTNVNLTDADFDPARYRF